MTTTKTITVRCPACDARIRFQNLPTLGDLLRCPECRTRLEVIKNIPLKLDWASDNGLNPFNDYLY